MISTEANKKVESFEEHAHDEPRGVLEVGDAPSEHKPYALLIGFITLMVLIATTYSSLYFREDSIPGGIGANLVPAERVLEGEVPYRDFYKIQTPGVVLLNAALFKLFGTTLLTALGGVMIFKLLTVGMVLIVARLVLPVGLALVPALLSFLWLPPGGPFRPAPMQYGMLFILLALFFAMRWLQSRGGVDVFIAGVSVGLVALFKQNVGVYVALALVIIVILESSRRYTAVEDGQAIQSKSNTRSALIFALAGIAIPLAGLFVYLVANRALVPAARIFMQGPGEHIQMKFTGYPNPAFALIILIVAAAALKVATSGIRRFPQSSRVIVAGALLAAAVCAALVPQSFIDNSIFWFPPFLFLYGAWVCIRKRGKRSYNPAYEAQEGAVLLVLLLFSTAAYLEVFPRSVRGLLIGTLPPAFILFTFLFTRSSTPGRLSQNIPTFSWARHVKLAVFAIVAVIFAGRLIAPHYFSATAGSLSFKADTQMTFDRGAGVYLPSERAAEVNATVEFIRGRVEQDGYFFAHAIEATPYYFLGDRKSPTRATLWNDAGTNDDERARTMQVLQDKDVRLVLTSPQALSAERYQPLLELLETGFHESATIGRITFLERNY